MKIIQKFQISNEFFTAHYRIALTLIINKLIFFFILDRKLLLHPTATEFFRYIFLNLSLEVHTFQYTQRHTFVSHFYLLRGQGKKSTKKELSHKNCGLIFTVFQMTVQRTPALIATYITIETQVSLKESIVIILVSLMMNLCNLGKILAAFCEFANFIFFNFWWAVDTGRYTLFYFKKYFKLCWLLNTSSLQRRNNS